MPHFYVNMQTRLQAQAAAFPYQSECGPACSETNKVMVLQYIWSILAINSNYQIQLG